MKSAFKSALALALTAAAASSAFAGIIIHDMQAYPPGPTIMDMLLGCFGR